MLQLCEPQVSCGLPCKHSTMSFIARSSRHRAVRKSKRSTCSKVDTATSVMSSFMMMSCRLLLVGRSYARNLEMTTNSMISYDSSRSLSQKIRLLFPWFHNESHAGSEKPTFRMAMARLPHWDMPSLMRLFDSNPLFRLVSPLPTLLMQCLLRDQVWKRIWYPNAIYTVESQADHFDDSTHWLASLQISWSDMLQCIMIIY